MEEKIKAILLKEFGSVYCHNCSHDGDDSPCDECSRKSMYWSLSEERAGELAQKIIEVMGG